jgi:hypothetical protein
MVKVGDEEEEGYKEELRIENKKAVEVWYTWVLQRQPKVMTLMLPDVREAHLPYFSFQKYLIDLLGRKEKVLIEVSKVHTTIWVKCVKETLTSIYSICCEIISFCLQLPHFNSICTMGSSWPFSPHTFIPQTRSKSYGDD